MLPFFKITSAQVFIYLEIHCGCLPCVVVLFEKLQSSNQGQEKQKQISQLAGPHCKKEAKKTNRRLNVSCCK